MYMVKKVSLLILLIYIGVFSMGGCGAGRSSLNQTPQKAAEVAAEPELPAIPYSERVLIAVKDFDCVIPGFEHIGEQLTASITTELIKSESFRVVEREKIKEIMEEQALGMSGAVDEDAPQAGGLKGLSEGFVLTGSITDFGIKKDETSVVGFGKSKVTAKVAIDGRLIQPQTGEIVAAVNGKGEKSKSSFFAVDQETGEDVVRFGDPNFDSSQLGEATSQAIKNLIYELKKQVYGF
jgi:curli biogenesis system outer membrane secretion channel CsgG